MRQADQPGLINFAAGVPGLDALPFEALREATQAAFASDGAALFAYHHPEGDHALRALCAERLRQRGVADLAPTPVREVLCRSCRNLAHHYAAAGEPGRARLFASFVEEFESTYQRESQE